MKITIIYISVLSMLFLWACENSRHAEGNQSDDFTENDLRDGGELDSRTDTDQASEREGTKQDTTLPGPIHTRIAAQLPGKVLEKISTDPELKDLQLINNRSYEEEGETFYELTFDNQEKVTYDRAGTSKPK